MSDIDRWSDHLDYGKIDPAFKARWVEALRSGRYVRGQTVLHQTAKEEGGADKLCCLGVACVVEKIPAVRHDDTYQYTFGDSVGHRFTPVDGWMGLTREAIHHLVDMNDGTGADFPTIATWIEENL